MDDLLRDRILENKVLDEKKQNALKKGEEKHKSDKEFRKANKEFFEQKQKCDEIINKIYEKIIQDDGPMVKKFLQEKDFLEYYTAKKSRPKKSKTHCTGPKKAVGTPDMRFKVNQKKYINR